MLLKILSVYAHKGDGRPVAYVQDQDGNKYIISYYRALVENHLNRKLTDDEVVHHIDGNPLNNDLSNLQVMTKSEHMRLHQTKYHDKIMICPLCGDEFTWTALQQRLFTQVKYKNRRKGTERKLFCSKKCAGRYGLMVRYNKVPLELKEYFENLESTISEEDSKKC